MAKAVRDRLCVSGTSCQPARKSSARFSSGFQTGRGVAMRCWILQLCQAGDRRAVRAVDLEGDEVVAIDARLPGRVDLRHHAALQHEGGVGGVLGGRLVGLSVLVPALGDVGGAEAAQALDGAEHVVEHVAPVAEHIEDDAAAVLAAIVPGRPLDRLQVALEDPVAELAAHREHAAEEAGIAQHLQLHAARAGRACPARCRSSRRALRRAARWPARRRGSWRTASRNRHACRPRSPGGSSAGRICVVPASKKTSSSGSASAAARSVVQR